MGTLNGGRRWKARPITGNFLDIRTSNGVLLESTAYGAPTRMRAASYAAAFDKSFSEVS
jgi:hypothetical protein